jgi:hypothetical protein
MIAAMLSAAASAARKRGSRTSNAEAVPLHRKLPAGALVRLFECGWSWQGLTGAGLLEETDLANCVANELSATYLPTCSRACSSVIAGHEADVLKLKNGTLGILISGTAVHVVGAFPHDADTIGLHGCMTRQAKCNSSRTGWSARVYAQSRYSIAWAACAKNLDPWRAHRTFIYHSARAANCMHSTRAAAERFQKAFLSLLERKPLPRSHGRLCSPGPLWNQLMVHWRFTDIIGVVYTADARRAAMQVHDAIQRLDMVFNIQRRSPMQMYLL